MFVPSSFLRQQPEVHLLDEKDRKHMTPSSAVAQRLRTLLTSAIRWHLGFYFITP